MDLTFITDTLASTGILNYIQLIIAYVSGLLYQAVAWVTPLLPESLAPFAANIPTIVAFVLAALCVVIALYSAKFVKFLVTLVGSVTFGVAGAALTGYAIDNFGINFDLPFNVEFVVGLICAFIGVGCSYALFSVLVFAAGTGAIGYIAYTYIIMYQLSSGELQTLLMTAGVGLVGGFLMVTFFKLFYILLSSVGGMGLAGMLVAISVAPNDLLVCTGIIAVSLLAGLVASFYQFRHSHL